MILTPPPPPSRMAKALPWVMAGLLGIIIALALWPAKKPRLSWPEEEGPALIYCDAETVRGNRFLAGDRELDYGQYQASDKSRSGRYSCRVPPGEGLQFGFTAYLDAFQPGEVYRVSVWRWKNQRPHAYLTVQAEGPENIFRSTDQPVSLENSGWEMLQLYFMVPFDKKVRRLSAYVYTDGRDTVWFDDLRVEKILHFPRQTLAPEVIDLEIPAPDLRRLESEGARALKIGVLEPDQNTWVQAGIRSGNQILPAELRLKGDWVDHLQTDKWSYRVKLGGEDAWNQMQYFSLQSPHTRYYLHEWLLHRFWERESVLATRYEFVELRLNGESKGLYAVEEHFTRLLLEYHRRREGPIVRFDESGFWQGMKRRMQNHGLIQPALQQGIEWADYAEILPFDDQNSPPPLAGRAAELLQALRTGARPPAEIFDLERMARYFASCDLFSAYHAMVWNNQRFYYNPLLDRLEPIGFDGFGNFPEARHALLGQGLTHSDAIDPGEIFAFLFLDPAFVEKYLHYLDMYSQPAYLRDFLDEMEPEWLQRQFYLLEEGEQYFFDPAPLYDQQRRIRTLILPYARQSLHARREGDSILLHNRHGFPLEVVGMGATDQYPDRKLETPLILPAAPARRIYLEHIRDSLFLPQHPDQWTALAEAAWRSARDPYFHKIPASPGARMVFYRLPGLDSLYATPILEGLPEGPDFARAGPSFPIGEVSGKIITIPAGLHLLTSSLVVPAGYELRIQPGAQVEMREGAQILVRGNFSARGEADRPIRLYSPDASGGLAVLQPSLPCTLRYVVAESLNAPPGYSGALTFYEADVFLDHCQFLKAACEDALNLIRCEVHIQNSLISQAAFDGLDCDFCRGEIRNLRVFQTGNDCMDFSGSVCTLEDILAENAGDKGISMGEDSDITMNRVFVQNARIGVAVKDLSFVLARELTLEAVDLGLELFQKKPEFGQAYLLVQGLHARQVKKLSSVQTGSILHIDPKKTDR